MSTDKEAEYKQLRLLSTTSEVRVTWDENENCYFLNQSQTSRQMAFP